MLRTHISTSGETLISIVIGVILLGIVITGILNLISTNNALEDSHDRNNRLFILKNNATNIIRKTDTSTIKEGEMFFLYKNQKAKIYQTLTGAENEMYKYINSAGDLIVNTGSYIEASIYTRSFYVEKKDTKGGPQGQVVKAAIKELIRK